MSTLEENAYRIQGGKTLRGEVTVSGAKNVVLKVLVAALLFEEPVVFTNVPVIRDILELTHLLEEAGVKVNYNGNHEIHVDPRGLHSHTVDLLHAAKIRVSFMLFAPFLVKFGKAVIPNPGGCRLGARPIDRQIELMNAFGVSTEYDSSTGYYTSTCTTKQLEGATYRFSKQTHTGTELGLLLAVRARGRSVIENAALEPEIDDLIDFLNTSGAAIHRQGSKIIVDGVPHLHSPKVPHRIVSDRNEVVTFACAALASKGDIMVRGAIAQQLTTFLEHIDAIGGKYAVSENGIRFWYESPLKAVSITTAPEPGFMTDWQAPWAVMMTQAEGVSSIHETIFENRFGYVSELRRLGAKIRFELPEVRDPYATYQFNIKKTAVLEKVLKKQMVTISGPTSLHGGVVNVTDLRAGATLVIAACIASGESVVNGVSIIERGYEHLENKLHVLGADIERV